MLRPWSRCLPCYLRYLLTTGALGVESLAGRPAFIDISCRSAFHDRKHGGSFSNATVIRNLYQQVLSDVSAKTRGSRRHESVTDPVVA